MSETARAGYMAVTLVGYMGRSGGDVLLLCLCRSFVVHLLQITGSGSYCGWYAACERTLSVQ